MSLLLVALEWPLHVYYDVMAGLYLPGLAAVGVAYYVGGGAPWEGQDSMTMAKAYLAGGAGYLAADYVLGDSPSAAPSK